MTPLAFNAAVAVMPAAPHHTAIPDHDLESIVTRFGRQGVVDRSSRSIDTMLAQANTTTIDYNASTFGEITFRRVDPLRETEVVADARLQARLEDLCSALRSKY